MTDIGREQIQPNIVARQKARGLTTAYSRHQPGEAHPGEASKRVSASFAD
jgi:hypothetical protein